MSLTTKVYKNPNMVMVGIFFINQLNPNKRKKYILKNKLYFKTEFLEYPFLKILKIVQIQVLLGNMNSGIWHAVVERERNLQREGKNLKLLSLLQYNHCRITTTTTTTTPSPYR